ncbi:hypothetical protein IMZ48_06470 [Candidatus Bathyarchaeota archaeon]|nr:hypothetical protein [Candidatus Bathyarchaeota archaeon]
MCLRECAKQHTSTPSATTPSLVTLFRGAINFQARCGRAFPVQRLPAFVPVNVMFA